MNNQRYKELQEGDGPLTAEESAGGWFFDMDYDGLLVHRSWPGHRGNGRSLVVDEQSPIGFSRVKNKNGNGPSDI